MSGQTVVKLADVASINPKLKLRPHATKPVSFVPMAAVDAVSGRVIEQQERPFGEVQKGYTLFVDGDLLLAKITPCFENGKIAQAELHHSVGAGSTEFHVIRPDASRIDARFLLFFLRQEYIRRAGERRMTGSGGQRRVPEQFVADLEVPLPPLEQQRKIVEMLGRADGLRAKRRESQSRLIALAISVYLEMFGDPVTNPRGWPVGTLMELGALERGVSVHRPRNAPELLGGIYPLIQTGDVANSGGIIRGYRATYSEVGLAQSRLWPAGTLCITIAANIAKTGVLAFDACFPDSVVGFTAEPATVRFVQAWLGFLQKSLEESAPESAQKNINLAILRGLPVPQPPTEMIEEFARRLAAVDELKGSYRASLVELDALFASLQDRAFRGSSDVRRYAVIEVRGEVAR